MKPPEFNSQRINKIAYIIQYNPEGVVQLLEGYGLEVPPTPEALLEATQQLIRDKGRPVIHDLLQLHPDKHLLLKASGNDEETPAPCPNCQHDTYEPEPEIDIYNLSTRELEKYYQSLKQRLRDDPEDELALADLDLVIAELKYRRAQQPAAAPSPSKPKNTEGKQLAFLGLAFVLGVIVAKL